DIAVAEWLILHNEPLSRGAGSKPHYAEFCYRSGGQTVYVCSRHPAGLNEAAHNRLLEANPRARNWNRRVMRRDPQVYVKGRGRGAPIKRRTHCSDNLHAGNDLSKVE